MPARRGWQPSHPKPRDRDKSPVVGLLSRSRGDSGDTSRTVSPAGGRAPRHLCGAKGQVSPPLMFGESKRLKSHQRFFLCFVFLLTPLRSLKYMGWFCFCCKWKEKPEPSSREPSPDAQGMGEQTFLSRSLHGTDTRRVPLGLIRRQMHPEISRDFPSAAAAWPQRGGM